MYAGKLKTLSQIEVKHIFLFNQRSKHVFMVWHSEMLERNRGYIRPRNQLWKSNYYW